MTVDTSAPQMTETKYCSGCGKLIHKMAEQCPFCGARQANLTFTPKSRKSRIAAILFALLLGGLGAHKLYLGKPGAGIVYFIFFWTLIPSLIALVEAILWVGMSDEAFAAKYG